METWIQISPEPQASAWSSRHSLKEIPDMYICEWLLLAWTQCGYEHMESSECCKIPKSNREFWIQKIRRNKERDSETQKQLAKMGWHCITIWECELSPQKLSSTLKSLAFTLNKIWLKDHSLNNEMEGQYENRED